MRAATRSSPSLRLDFPADKVRPVAGIAYSLQRWVSALWRRRVDDSICSPNSTPRELCGG
jgi:hypothetical protein